jgi:hypothetical protein
MIKNLGTIDASRSFIVLGVHGISIIVWFPTMWGNHTSRLMLLVELFAFL